MMSIDNESGSSGTIAITIIGLLSVLAVIILFGGLIDQIFTINTITGPASNMSSVIPVSDERIATTNILVSIWPVYPIIFVFCFILYAWTTSSRDTGGDV